MLYVFTTAALNFVPCAKLLAASVKEHLPDAHFVLALADAPPGDFRLEDEGFDEVLTLDDLAADLDNPRGWAFGHTVMELATAMKPFVACQLMARDDCDAVMFFDPDCVLYADLAEMRAALEDHSVVLTPHASELHENPDWLFFERNPLKVGSFNLGYIGLRNSETGRKVASWWRFRCREHCLIDPEQGLFTDQKWIDLLPSYTDDLKVLREPVYNLARWNTFQRTLTREGDAYFVDGAPLQFIHFSGFYKVGPYVRGLYDRSSEPLVENKPLLEELSLWYSEALDGARTQAAYSATWALGQYENGAEIPDADRRRYRASADLQARFRDPFATRTVGSYWLYCRRQERLEEERTFGEGASLPRMVTTSVQAHNTILRRHNETLNAQLLYATGAAPAAPTMAAETFADAAVLRLSELAQATGPAAVRATFGYLVEERLLDPEWYLAENPDVAEAGLDPLVHFVRFGLAEGRAPSAGETPKSVAWRHLSRLMQEGDGAWLLRPVGTGMWGRALRGLGARRNGALTPNGDGRREDPAEAPIEDMVFATQDWARSAPENAIKKRFQRLSESRFFDADFYFRQYEDVRIADVDALVHFVRFGLAEGRRPSAEMTAEQLVRAELEQAESRGVSSAFAVPSPRYRRMLTRLARRRGVAGET
ncbi:MAG: hypothetical protein AAGE18_03110 [Pseudomonadota bacterium]